MVQQIFVNLPVKDLEKAKAFFSAVGFTFNPQFTDEKTACMVIGENIYAMLLLEGFFKGFLNGGLVSDAFQATEVLNALQLESREEVDAMIGRVLAAGGSEVREAEEYSYMYGRAFRDLDGHIWEVFHMDMSQAPEAKG